MKEKIQKAINTWANTPAAWWQFWMPQSGAVGGALVGTGCATILYGITRLF